MHPLSFLKAVVSEIAGDNHSNPACPHRHVKATHGNCPAIGYPQEVHHGNEQENKARNRIKSLLTHVI